MAPSKPVKPYVKKNCSEDSQGISKLPLSAGLKAKKSKPTAVAASASVGIPRRASTSSVPTLSFVSVIETAPEIIDVVDMAKSKDDMETDNEQQLPSGSQSASAELGSRRESGDKGFSGIKALLLGLSHDMKELFSSSSCFA